jgi:hypothetical protein
MQKELINSARKAAKLGDVVKLMNIGSSITNFKQFIQQIERSGGVSDTTKKKLKGLKEGLDEVNEGHRDSKMTAGAFLKTLNQIGFSVFLVKSSIQTLTGVFKGLFETFAKGAEQASLFQSFAKGTQAAGANLQLLRESLNATSRGMLDQNKTMQATLRLMKAGVPDFEKTAATMAGLAVNAASVSGELGNVDEIFEKLVKGIVRGSPRLIDDADVVLKLGNAYDRYAEKIGKATDALTEKEQQRAVVDALEEESIRMEELAGAIGTLPSEPFKVLENSARDLERGVMSVVGVIGSDLATSLVDSLGLGGEKFDNMADAMAAAEERAAEFTQALKEIKSIVEAIGNKKTLDNLGLSVKEGNERMIEFKNSLDTVQRLQVNLLWGWGVAKDFIMTMVRAGQILAEVVLLQVGVVWELAEAWVQTSMAVGQDMANMLQALKDRDFEALKEAGVDAWNTIKDGASDANEEIREGMKRDLGQLLDFLADADERIGRIFSEEGRAKFLSEALQATVHDLADVSVVAEQAANDMGAVHAVIAEIERVLGPQAKFLRDSEKVWADYGDKIVEINETWTEKVAELHDERLERIKDNWDKFNEKILEINEDLEDKLADIGKDFNKKKEKEQKKHQKKKEKNEESHQRKIDAIMRRFEMSRLRAIIDRDARALFEAEFRRDQDLEKAKEAIEDKKKQEQERHEEELEELAQQEEEKRQEAKEAAEKKRQDAEKDRAKEAAKIEEWHADEKRKAARRALDERTRAKEAADDRIADMKEALDERLATERLQAALRQAERVDELTDATEFENAMKLLWADLIDFAENNPVNWQMNLPPLPDFNTPPSTGTSDNPTPAPGGGADESDNPPEPGCQPNIALVITAYQRCSYPDNKVYIDQTCRAWRCRATNDGKKWVPDDGQGNVVIHDTNNNNRRSSGGSNFTDNSVGVDESIDGGNSTQVTISVTGDSTLEQIFKELAYDAYLEITA